MDMIPPSVSSQTTQAPALNLGLSSCYS